MLFSYIWLCGASCLLALSKLSMAEPTPKQRRIAQIGRGRHISQSTLSRVMSDLRENGIPDQTSKTTVRRARTAVACVGTPFGPVLTSIPARLNNGKEFLVPFQHPMAAIHHAVSTSSHFSEMLAEALRRSPSSPDRPWRLLTYMDEISPGNKLGKDNMRKLWAVYWSFYELGMDFLCREECWFVATCVRSHVVDQFDGGVSALFKLCMLQIFDDAGHHWTKGGMALNIESSVVMLFVKLEVLVGDLPALQQTWCAKQGGTKLCLWDKNCVGHKSQLEEYDCSGYLKASTHLDMRVYDPHTDASIRETVENLQRVKPTTGKTKFAAREQAEGFVHSCGNILHEPRMRGIAEPITVTMLDWMHVFVVGGLFQIDLGLLFSACKEEYPCDMYHDFLLNWHLPHQFTTRMGKLAHFFGDKRGPKHEKGDFKCDASEALCLFPVLAFFFMQVADISRPEIASFLLLCDCLDLLQVLARGCVAPHDLHVAVMSYLEAFQAAYGTEHWVPKHHFAMHLPLLYQRFGFLLACFVHERKHKTLMMYGNPILNTKSDWERSVMSSVTCDHFASLQESKFWCVRSGLLTPHNAPARMQENLREHWPDAQSIRTSADAAISQFSMCHIRDVVCFDSSGFGVGEVWFHCDVDGDQFSCISVWDVKSRKSTWVECTVKDNPRIVALGDILETTTYCRNGDDATVLLPPSLR